MRARAILLVAVLSASVTSAEQADAGLNLWTSNGPFGGSPTAITTHPTDPSVVLAGTDGGIFRSADGGSSWSRSSEGLPPNAGIMDLAFARSSPATIFASTYTAGLRKSTDGGRSWTSSSPGIGYGTIHTVVVNPTNANIVYIGAGMSTYKSVDGGASWTELFPESQYPTVSANELVIAPSAANTIYAAGSGWLRSTDGGETWGGPLKPPPHIQSAVVHPTNPDVVIAANQDGLYRTVDGGFTWSRTYEEPLPGMVSLAIDPTDPSRVYAGAYSSGAYRSLDEGRSWAAYNTGLPDDQTWLVRAGLSSYGTVLDLGVLADGSAIVAGTRYYGLFKRPTETAAWAPANEGLVGSHVGALATPPSGGPTVYAGVPGLGVARSRDNGASWQWTGLKDRAIESIAVHPTNASIVYAATNAGIYKSTNAGDSWRLVHRVGREADRSVEGHTAVAIAPSRPRVVYAATFEGGVFRSDDSGGTWRKLRLDQYSVVSSLAVHPEKPYTVYAGTRYLNVARSTDGGKTWRGRDDFCYGCDVQAIAIHPTQPSMLYAAMSPGIYRSTDSGRTWRRMEGGAAPRSAAAVVVDRSHPDVVYAGGYGDYPDDEPPGVFKSTDRGRTWTRLDSGLTTTWVASLALSRSGRVLHAGTTAYGVESGGGVFSRTFG